MKKILDFFKGIDFREETHQYFVEGEQYKSVSHYLKQFVTPFDEAFMAPLSARKRGITTQEILDEWHLKRDVSCEFGSYCHEELEKYACNKYLHKEIKPLTINMKLVDVELANKLIESGKLWLDYMIYLGYELVDTELMMFDKNKKICGTCDLLFKKDGKYLLADWKSNQSHELNRPAYNNEKMLGEYKHLPANSLGKYTAQLTTYRDMLGQVVDVFAEMIIIHLQEDGVKEYVVVDKRKIN